MRAGTPTTSAPAGTSFEYHRSRTRLRTVAHGERGHDQRADAREHTRPDLRGVLLLAVVVRGDGPRTDVACLAHDGVAKVGVVPHLDLCGKCGCLQLGEVPDMRTRTDGAARANVCKRPDIDAVGDPG